MNKAIFATFLLLSLAGLALKSCDGAGFVDTFKKIGVEGTVEQILKSSDDDKYSDRPEFLKCVVKDMLNSNIGERIVSGRNPVDEVNSLKQHAEIKCEVGLFLQSPFGVIVIILVLLILTLMCCCCLRRYCC